ncbi:MAG: TSUP family transporter, partial [Pseudohongiellaceae bacterium]
FAGLGYFFSGYVDMLLLASLLLGSLPAIHLGSRVSNRLPDGVLQKLLVSVLLLLGLYYTLLQ